MDIQYTVEYIKEKYKHYLYIELMPEERKNAAFYEKHGFRIMPDGAPMFLANYENKILNCRIEGGGSPLRFRKGDHHGCFSKGNSCGGRSAPRDDDQRQTRPPCRP